MPDSAEFDSFYRGTAGRLLRYAYGLTADAAEAQDLVQEAYARAWQRWRRLQQYEDPEAWLRLVVNRLAHDWFRRLRVRRNAVAAHQPPAPEPPPDENVILIVAALRTLPAAQRRALTLHYLLDLPVAQIATEIGANVSTVKSWLHRGRAALAEALATSDATRQPGMQAARVPASNGGPDGH